MSYKKYTRGKKTNERRQRKGKHSTKKRKGTKNIHKKNTRRGYLRDVGGDRRNITSRIVTRRLGIVLQKRKECLRNLVNTLYKLGAARFMNNGLLQRIEMTREQGKYVPSTAEEWQKVIELKASKYRFENPQMNLLEEEINPVDGFLSNLVFTEMSKYEKEEIVLDRIERNIDAQKYVEAVLEFNRVLRNFAIDPSYLYQEEEEDDPIVYVREGVNPFVENELRALRSELVKPVLIKGRINKTKMRKIATAINRVREIDGLIQRGQYQEATIKAGDLIVIYCKPFFISLLRNLLEIYEDQFISLIPFLPNYMFQHYEAKISHDAGIQYNTSDEVSESVPTTESENIIVDNGDWSDMESSDDDVEDMGETDGELDVGGPHPDAPVPPDF